MLKYDTIRSKGGIEAACLKLNKVKQLSGEKSIFIESIHTGLAAQKDGLRVWLYISQSKDVIK